MVQTVNDFKLCYLNVLLLKKISYQSSLSLFAFRKGDKPKIKKRETVSLGLHNKIPTLSSAP